MRISDWSSDVCSSDLSFRKIGRDGDPAIGPRAAILHHPHRNRGAPDEADDGAAPYHPLDRFLPRRAGDDQVTFLARGDFHELLGRFALLDTEAHVFHLAGEIAPASHPPPFDSSDALRSGKG